MSPAQAPSSSRSWILIDTSYSWLLQEEQREQEDSRCDAQIAAQKLSAVMSARENWGPGFHGMSSHRRSGREQRHGPIQWLVPASFLVYGRAHAFSLFFTSGFRENIGWSGCFNSCVLGKKATLSRGTASCLPPFQTTYDVTKTKECQSCKIPVKNFRSKRDLKYCTNGGDEDGNGLSYSINI
ncbi:hypothetical protein SETIT_1G144600v2 [Setaria italica]|uniref:Uncharacterized protein n=1 Tax=Setaria italica TaxID=4555 RepID=A0A368PKB2_SETIT|nr:hypothetical protein SETIT_1G144600v2 [Setaria italica]